MPVAELTVDRSLLYERVREELRTRCAQPAGTALPSLRELSSQLDVNHVTVLRALRDLEEEGLVDIVPRKGIFVRNNGAKAAGKNIELVTLYLQQKNILDVAVNVLHGMKSVAGTGIIHSSTLSIPPLPDATEFIRTMQQRQVGAVLFLGVQYLKYPYLLDEANFLRQISEQIPTVVVGHPHQIMALDCVYADPRPQLYEFLEQCYDKGLRRFGFLGVHPSAIVRERFETFKEFLLKRQLEWDDCYALPCSSTPEEDVRQYFQQKPLPEVLVTIDSYALVAMMEAHWRGIKLGEEMQIVTFASQEWRMPPLLNDITVIMVDDDEVGKRAYEFAQQKMLDPQQKRDPVIKRVPGRFLNNLLER